MRSINDECFKNGRLTVLRGTGIVEAIPARDDEILTVPEIALRLRVKASWVYMHADALGAYRLGKYLRFSWHRVQLRLDQNSFLGSQPNDLKPNH